MMAIVTPIRFIVTVACLLVLAAACQKTDQPTLPQTPLESYRHIILNNRDADHKLIQRWIAASDTVLNHAVPVTIPFQVESVYFGDEANTWAWKFSASEGRILRAKIMPSDSSHKVFWDLFALQNNDTLLVFSTRDSLISYEIKQSQSYILRLQTELFVNGSFTIELTDQPSMIFPVAGGRPYDIGGKWGDPRDGGDRYHMGIDIFAEHKTPAVAAAGGWISKVGLNPLGGKVVWLNTLHKSLYYAHLDSVLVSQGQAIQQGDTLGLVGTSGNARSTPPHLHFGIYGFPRDVDPLPFIDDPNTYLPPITVDLSIFNKWGRVRADNVNIRPRPSTQHPNTAILNRNETVKVLGGTGNWYQIQLPDGKYGFVNKRFLEPTTQMTSTHAEIEIAK